MTLKKWLNGILIVAVFLLISACQSAPETEPEDDTEPENVTTSSSAGEGAESVDATLINQDNEAVGSAVLTENPDGVHIELTAKDLSPGKHGFHIHEKGVCNPPDFKSSGGHFNPSDAKHGFDEQKGPHAGDMLNITVEEDGTVEKEVVNDMVTLKPGESNSLLDKEGTSMMIHSEADDYKSQPSGDAGKREACAVIGK